MATLLEKALNVRTRVPAAKHDPEMLELALAWLSASVTLTQVATAIQLPANRNQQAVYSIARALKHAYLRGELIITRAEAK